MTACTYRIADGRPCSVDAAWGLEIGCPACGPLVEDKPTCVAHCDAAEQFFESFAVFRPAQVECPNCGSPITMKRVPL